MPRRSQLLATFCCLAYCTASNGAETKPQPAANSSPTNSVVQRPLSRVRSYGTVNRGLRSNKPAEHAAILEKIHQTLSRIPDKDSVAPPAFVVAGEVAEALAAMQGVIVDGKPPQHSFPTDEQLSLVFFTYLSPQFVRLKSIEQTANRFTIEYRFINREESMRTQYFALVPIGKLPPGSYELRIAQAPPDEREVAFELHPPADDVVKATICQSGKFEVTQ